MTILVILVILILIICGVLAYQKMNVAEGFDLGANTELSTCPLQSISYLDRNGDTLCCEGSLGPEGDCAKPLCALAKRKDMPSCKAMLDQANRKSANICPPSLPNYYTDGKGTTGCTDGALNNERTAPSSMFSKTCKVYPNTPVKIDGKLTSYTANDTNMDSCAVQRRLELDRTNMKGLFKSSFIDTVPLGKPIINLITYKPPNSTAIQSSTCYSKDTLIFIFNNMPLDGHFFTTEVGRKAYIDLINDGFSTFDCSVQKTIQTDKTFTDRLNKYQETHPNLFK